MLMSSNLSWKNAHWDEEDTITKLLQLDLDTKSAKRQPEPLGLDIIACDLLSSEFGGATHSQSLEQSAADTGSEAGRPTDSSFGDQHHGSSHRDALSPRGVHSLESDPRDKMDDTDGKDSQRVLSQSDVSGADLQSADQPPLLENPTALSTPGLQSGSEHLLSEETFQARQDQGEKLPGIALPSAGFTTSPSVQAVSCSRVSNLTSETWSVSNPSCSGKITSGSQSAIQSLSVNAPEFRPTSLSMQSPDMTASGNTPQMYMPVVETPVAMVGSGQYNLPAYQPGLPLAHVPGGTVPYMAQPVVGAQFTPAVGQVAACAPVGMNLYQPQHFPYFPQPPVNPSFCQAHWSTAPVAEQQRLLTAQRFVGPATTPAPATTMRHIPMQAVPDPLTIRPQINKASSSKDMGAYSEKLKKGNPIRVSYPEKLVKEAVTQASTGNISEMSAHLVERIKQYEERKVKVLVIMRGLPGSGKSYLAKKIQGSGEVFSTDDFFMQEGVYKFAPDRLHVAHEWNQKRVQKALDKAVTPAIVDNTNLEIWEMLPYGKMAHLGGYTIEIVEPDTPWNFKPSHLAKLNIHKVSVENIRKMKAKYEPISLSVFKRKVKDYLRSLNKTSAVEKQPQEKGPVDSSSYARPGVQEKQPGGRGPMKNSPDPPDPQFKRNPKHRRKGPKTDSQVVRVTDHCLSQLKAGASKEELDALIYLSNLGEKEKREIWESLRKFDEANVGKKDVDENPRVFADVEKFSRESRSVAAGEKSSRGARMTGEKTATDCEATDWGLAAEQRDQQMGAGRRADPRRAGSAQSWVTAHPQHIAKGNVAAEAEPQAGELGWTSLVTEDRSPASAHSLTWHSPLPHRRLNEQILKSLKGRKLGEESVDEKSSSKSAGSGFREPAGERTSWASWGSQWLVEDASSWQASSKFKGLDQQESYSKTELSGTGQSQSEAETQNAGEVSVKSKMSGKTTELKKDVGSGGEPEDRATKTQEAQSSKASNQSHMGVEAVQELSRQPGEESVSSSEAFPFRQEAGISVSDVSELPEAECGSEVLKHGRGNLEKSAILSVQAEEQVDSAASVTEAERDREPGFSLASGGEGNVLQVHTAATVSGAAVDAKPEPLTFSGTLDDSSSSSAKSGLSSQTGDKASTECREALQTGSSRKKRVKKHKMPHEPFLQDSAKQLLNSDNWKTFEPEKLIPGAERSAVTGQGPGDGLSIKAGITDQEKIEKNHCHTETQTEGKDFGILLKATTRDLEEGYKVMKPNNHFVSSENHFCTAQRWRISFDKSTNLDMPVKPSVDEMHTLFPDAAEAHLNEVLEVCHGDVDLAIDLMFEWGITTPLTARDKQHLLRETSFPSLTEAEDSGREEGRPVPGLLDLCMELLTRLGVDSHRLQQLIITSSQQRLMRLETCEYRRLSSINAESNKESPPEGFVEELQASFDLLAFTPSECGAVWESEGEEEEEEREGERKGVPEGDLTLTLPASLVSNLEQLFGHLPFAHTGVPRPCTVQLDHSTAWGLHRCVAQSLCVQHVASEEERQRQLREDEALAQRLQEEEGEVDLTTQHHSSSTASKPSVHGKRAARHRQYGSGDLRQIAAAAVPVRGNVVPLTEIMEEEMERQQIREIQAKQLEARGNHIAIATKLKRQKLQQHFPGMDEDMLEEVFEANEYCLETTMMVLEDALGGKKPVSHKLHMASADASSQEEDDDVIEMVKERSLQDVMAGGGEAGEVWQRVDALAQSDPSYEELRQEAWLHHSMRKECFHKAHHAHRKGMGHVADFYAKQGRDHFERMKDAHKRASERLLETRYDRLEQEMTLDLHGFHVDEAIAVFKRVVEQKEREFGEKPVQRRHYLLVITGRGKHSQHGVPRLRPALMAHLETTGYRFEEIKPGLVKVYLQRPA